MTYRQLINAYAQECGLSKTKATKHLEILTKLITGNMVKGEKTQLTGFGTFDLGKRATRRGVNPQTFEAIQIPEMPMPQFRAGKTLKETIRATANVSD